MTPAYRSVYWQWAAVHHQSTVIGAMYLHVLWLEFTQCPREEWGNLPSARCAPHPLYTILYVYTICAWLASYPALKELIKACTAHAIKIMDATSTKMHKLGSWHGNFFALQLVVNFKQDFQHNLCQHFLMCSHNFILYFLLYSENSKNTTYPRQQACRQALIWVPLHASITKCNQVSGWDMSTYTLDYISWCLHVQ